MVYKFAKTITHFDNPGLRGGMRRRIDFLERVAASFIMKILFNFLVLKMKTEEILKIYFPDY